MALLFRDVPLGARELAHRRRPLLVERPLPGFKRVDLNGEVFPHRLKTIEEGRCRKRVLRRGDGGGRAGIHRAGAARRRW